MKSTQILFFALTTLFLTSCDETFIKPGPRTEETTALKVFSKLELNGCVDATFEKSDTYEVRIEAGENHIKFVRTEVVGDWLILDEDIVNINHEIRAFVKAPNLDEILINGAGDVDATDLTGPSLHLSIAGSGDMDIKANTDLIDLSIAGSGDVDIIGTTGNFKAEIKGSGDIGARHLEAAIADLHIKGSGDAKLNVSDDCFVSIAGSGDVHVYGKPTVLNTSISGSGDIIEH